MNCNNCPFQSLVSKCDMKDEGYNLVADHNCCPFRSFVSTYGVRYVPVIDSNLTGVGDVK